MSLSIKFVQTEKKVVLSTKNPFEKKFGYHRALRRGPYIAVSGTTALKLQEPPPAPGVESSTSEQDEETHAKVLCPGDAYGQAVHIFETCLDAVVALGGTKADVIRVRMFVANSADCGRVGDAFCGFFGDDQADTTGEGSGLDLVGTTATMIVVPGGFVDEAILVEIEVDAFVV